MFFNVFFKVHNIKIMINTYLETSKFIIFTTERFTLKVTLRGVTFLKTNESFRKKAKAIKIPRILKDVLKM